MHLRNTQRLDSSYTGLKTARSLNTGTSTRSPPHSRQSGPSLNSPGYLALVGGTIYVSPTEEPIPDGVALIQSGKIAAVGNRAVVQVPQNTELLIATL